MGSAFATTEDEGLDHEINVEMVNYNIPGMMVTVVKNGMVQMKAAYGDANITTKTPMDTGLSLIQTGSISKVLTTYALLELLKNENISVDDSIEAYLPDYLKDNDYLCDLTYKNLLTHTTGLAALKADSANQEDPLRTMKLSFADNAKQFFETYRLKPVIEKDNYTIVSNVGYLLAGVLIESISGERYEYYMAEHVLTPMEMTVSGDILMGRNVIGPKMVQNYSVYGGSKTPLSHFNTKYLPSEDFITTVDDMTKFLMRLTSNSLSEDMKEAMFTRQIANNPYISGKSYGFTVVKYGKYEAYIHDGGIPGSNSRLLVIPKLNLGIFLTYNSNNLEARESFTNVVLGDLIEDFKKTAVEEPYPIEDLSKFTGVYSPVNASEETIEKLTRIIHQVRIKATATGIEIDSDVYVPISETIFYCEENETFAEFRTNESGQLEYLIVGNSIYERTSFFQSKIVAGSLIIFMTICNALGLLILLTKWSDLKVHRIHETPRFIFLLHSLAISGILIFILIISSSYDIWDVIYGINIPIYGTRLFGIGALILSFPAALMLNHAKQDYRWNGLILNVYRIQWLLGLFLIIWLFIYNLI